MNLVLLQRQCDFCSFNLTTILLFAFINHLYFSIFALFLRGMAVVRLRNRDSSNLIIIARSVHGGAMLEWL